jgi:hypothetical protein
MPIELEIVWDGDAPGLRDHRLSLGAFSESLSFLLLALRRIATKIVGEAVEGDGPNTGRFTNEARQLDIQIERIVGNSSGFRGAVALHNPTGRVALFDFLAESAGSELLDAIREESHGIMKNFAVRRYLRALPHGVLTQRYVLRDGDRLIRDVSIGTMELPDPLADLAYLREFSGFIVGVGFEPGKSEVLIKSNDGHVQRLAASARQVETALELRGEEIKVLAVIQEPSSRLLRIRKLESSWPTPSRDAALFGKWDELLRRLAR